MSAPHPVDVSALPDAAAAARARRAWWGFLTLVLGQFMAVLDIQIVASSINELQAGLAASRDEIQWVQTAYLIAEIIAVPLSGYLTKMMSTRVYFTICTLGFTLASVGCAAAWNLGSMVVFRVLQGFLGGGMIPVMYATMFTLFKGEKLIVPQLIAGMTAMLAPTLGPTLGGYLTDALSWHWLFLMNLIPGVATATAAWWLLDFDRPQWLLFRRLDWYGLVCMAVFLGSLEYTLDEGPRNDWLADDTVRLTALTLCVSGVLFLRRMLTSALPIVDLRAFANRNFAMGSLISGLLGMCLYTLVYLTPLFLGEVRGYNPAQIGAVMMVQGLSMIVTAPFAGRLTRYGRPRLMMAAGLFLVVFSTGLNAQLTGDWGWLQFALPQALRGCGLVLCFIPLTNVALGTMPADKVGNASGLFNLTRNLGGAIGLALINTLLNQRTWLHWQQLAEATPLSRAPVREALANMQHSLQSQLGAAAPEGALGLFVQQVQQQVAVMTFGDLYWILAGLSALAMASLVLISPPRAAVSVAAH